MSIFKHPQIDSILLNMLDIDDLARLSQTNTYYRNVIKPQISHYQAFFEEPINITNKKTHNYMLILKSIKFGEYDIFKYILKRFGYTQEMFDDRDYLLFMATCDYGNFDMMKHIYNLMEDRDESILYSGLKRACANGNLKMIQWLCDKSKNEHHYNLELAIEIASENGHFDVVRWFLSIPSLRDFDEDVMFEKACKYGHIDIVKRYVNNHDNHRSVTQMDSEILDDLEIVYLNIIQNGWIEAAKNMHFDIVEYLNNLKFSFNL